MISLLFNKFMPGALGGDIVKTIYAVKAQNRQRMKNVIAILIDRIIGLVSILIFGVASMIMIKEQLEIEMSHFIIIFVVFVGAFFLLTNTAILDFLSRLSTHFGKASNLLGKIILGWKESISYYRSNKTKVLSALLLCFPIHLASFVIFYIFSQSIGISINFIEIVFAISIMWLIIAMPISIGGMGIREFSLVWLLGFFNVSSELAVSISFMSYINSVLVSLLALPMLIEFKKYRAKIIKDIQ